MAVETADELTWTVRLYERAPDKRYIVFFFALFAASIGLVAFNNPFFAILGLVAVLASTAEFWLPLTYKLDKSRAAVRCGFSVTAIEWSNVRRVVTSEEGWKLSPHKDEGRTSPFRGVYLRFGSETNQVQAFVKSHIDGGVRFVEHRTDAGRGGAPSRESGERDLAAENAEPSDIGSGSP